MRDVIESGTEWIEDPVDLNLDIDKLELVNVNGQLQQIDYSEQEGIIEISNVDLAEGVYFLRIYTQDGCVVKKVTKG